MKEIADLLNEMCQVGIIRTYAIFGAVAQMRYTEAVVTMDLDVLVAIPDIDSLAILHPIYEFCAQKGYQPEGEAIRVGAWPVQFIPTFDDLSQEAVDCAEEADTEYKNLLERQASWQKARKNESWGDKLRKSVQARDSLRKFISSKNSSHH